MLPVKQEIKKGSKIMTEFNSSHSKSNKFRLQTRHTFVYLTAEKSHIKGYAIFLVAVRA